MAREEGAADGPQQPEAARRSSRRESRESCGSGFSEDLSYPAQLASRIHASDADRGELAAHLGDDDAGEAAEYIERALAASGLADLAARGRLVAAAAARQQQLALKRSRKKAREAKEDRLRDPPGAAAATRPTRRSTSPVPSGAATLPVLPGPGRGGQEPASNAAGGRPATGPDAPTPREVGEVAWSKVQEFVNEEEALRFVIECQPIDYRPVQRPGYGDEPFPRYESTRDAFEHVKRMVPWPQEFEAAEDRFHRYLRIRKHEPKQEVQALAAVPPGSSGRRMSARRTSMMQKTRSNKIADVATHLVEKRRAKPWVVESAGTLFDRLESLRDLHRETVPSRYFIAIDPDLERRVLAEGFRVRRRCSIPCSASAAEARQAFIKAIAEKGQQEASGRFGSAPSVAVLAVTLPPCVDVLANKGGGFLLRTQEIAPQYLKSVRRAGGNDWG